MGDGWFIFLGWVLAVGGMALIWFGLWRDRTRHRRGELRCGRCWYALRERQAEGKPAEEWPVVTLPAVCSECGLSHRSIRQLQRTRRRWSAAALGGVLVLGAWPVSQWPVVERDGVMASAPMWSLIALHKCGLDGEDGLIDTEMMRRLRGVSGWAKGFDRAAASALLTSQVITRSEWPAGESPRVILPSAGWGAIRVFRGPPGEAYLENFDTARFETLMPELITPSAAELSHERYWFDPSIAVFEPRDGPWADRSPPGVELGGMVGMVRGFTTRRWRAAADASSILRPVSGPEIDRAVLEYLAPRIIRGISSGYPGVSIINGKPHPEKLIGVALGLRLTVVRRPLGASEGQEEIAGAGECWHAGRPIDPNGQASLDPIALCPIGPGGAVSPVPFPPRPEGGPITAFEFFRDKLAGVKRRKAASGYPTLLDASADFFPSPLGRMEAAQAAAGAVAAVMRPGESWVLVIESDPRLAIRDMRAERYWKGRLEVKIGGVASDGAEDAK